MCTAAAPAVLDVRKPASVVPRLCVSSGFLATPCPLQQGSVYPRLAPTFLPFLVKFHPLSSSWSINLVILKEQLVNPKEPTGGMQGKCLKRGFH